MGHQVIIYDNLLKMLLTYYCKQAHIFLNFLYKICWYAIFINYPLKTNYFLIMQIDTILQKYMQATQNTSAGHGLRASGLDYV
jgi:hypothetical protein